MTNHQIGWIFRVSGAVLCPVLWYPFLRIVAWVLEHTFGVYGGFQWVAAFFFAGALSIGTLVGFSTYGVSVQKRSKG